MSVIPQTPKTGILLAALCLALPVSVYAQQEETEAAKKDIIVQGQEPDPSAALPMTKGPEIKGIISARSGDRLQVTTDDGNKTIIGFNKDQVRRPLQSRQAGREITAQWLAHNRQDHAIG
jgi:OmpA-OmpF porin, OOP family